MNLSTDAERELLALRDRLQSEEVTEEDLRAALVCVTEAYDALVSRFCVKPRDYANPNHSAMFEAWNWFGSESYYLWLATARKP